MTEDGFKAPPIAGYTDQTEANKKLVNLNKEVEEKLLRVLDTYMTMDAIDKRWTAIAKTHLEQGFMAMNRAVFKPQRISLPEDQKNDND